MSDPTNKTQPAPEVPPTAPAPNERQVLMERAKMMGLKVSPNIGLDTLREKINAVVYGEKEKQAAVQELEDEQEGEGEGELEEPPVEQQEEEEAPEQEEVPVPPQMKASAKPPKKETRQQIRERLLKEATALVRLRITNLDPKKKDLPGEIFTVANEYIGTVRKYVPFGEVTENGYHVPKIIYDLMKERRFLNIRVRKVNGREHVETGYVPEFALEILPPLTPAEIKRLAVEQAARNGGSVEQ